ncbi:YHS domain-containing (seleno)protein [Psychroflexus sp. MES1-P1E]|uniref:YHS domain-containing (seleno)protein n=1 Tax=Psychroflexus sp. MES1-P1E TaxID=2058320 RepID=UPI000C7D0758|nr:YHS domain-containing (seleno)protein [Psychroflexus sp. MES1-P1E]PKG43777.1 YHS domain protein [Psychroflexus sp. MES1-P1E]
MKIIKKVMVMCMLFLGMTTLFAQNVNVNKDGAANSGYDLVNYFTSNTAERGNKDYSVIHNGATYYFINTENKKTFIENPDNYLPQFDGYCAFAVAKMDKKVHVDPKTFRIDDGKLYLFYNDFWEGKPFNTMIPWLNNELQLENLAITNWGSLKKS